VLYHSYGFNINRDLNVFVWMLEKSDRLVESLTKAPQLKTIYMDRGEHFYCVVQDLKFPHLEAVISRKPLQDGHVVKRFQAAVERNPSLRLVKFPSEAQGTFLATSGSTRQTDPLFRRFR